MSATSVRLLALLAVLQARPVWTGPELSERLEVTPRTLRRDIDRLRGLDYPIESVPGRGGGYRFGSGGKLPPLLLDDDEAIAVAVGLSTAAGDTVTGVSEASLRALVKLDQVLPWRLRHQVDALRAATEPIGAGTPTVAPEALVLLARACASYEVVRFGYRRADGTQSRRIVEPHRLVPTGRRWYLVARDRDRDDWRSFRLDRVDAPDLTGLRFTPTDAPDAAEFVSRGVSSAPYEHQARVIIHAPAQVVREVVPATVGTVTDIDAKSCELATGSDSLDAIALHLAWIGQEFDVLEPPELADAVDDLAARLARGTQPTREQNATLKETP